MNADENTIMNAGGKGVSRIVHLVSRHTDKQTRAQPWFMVGK